MTESLNQFPGVDKSFDIFNNENYKEIKPPHFNENIAIEILQNQELNLKLKSLGKKVFVFSTRYSISKELIASSTKYFDTKKFKDVFLK